MRSQSRRTNGRAVALGIGVSLAAHAAVLAFMSMEVPAIEQRKPVPVVFEDGPVALELEPVMEVVQLRVNEASALSLESMMTAGGGAEEAGSSPSNVPAPADAHAVRPAVSTSDLAYDKLLIVAPAQTRAATPVAFDALEAAETVATAAPEKDEDVPVYVPGSIGRAKRGWAASGDADGTGRNGMRSGWTLVDGRGDGHCPMDPPGRGLPPTILR